MSSLLHFDIEKLPADPLPSVPVNEVLAEMAISSASEDRVLLKGLRTQALIGVYDHERLAPRPLVVDLEIGLASSRSCFSDDLADAVDYDEVAKTIHTLASENKTQLLEAFAQKIAVAVLTNFDAKWVQVDIVKPAVLTEANAVGVSIRRARPFTRQASL